MRQKGFAHLFILVAAVIVTIGAIGYLAYQNAQLKKEVDNSVTSDDINSNLERNPTEERIKNAKPFEYTEDSTAPDIADWGLYRNDSFNYEFYYPNYVSVAAGGAGVVPLNTSTNIILYSSDIDENPYFLIESVNDVALEKLQSESTKSYNWNSTRELLENVKERTFSNENIRPVLVEEISEFKFKELTAYGMKIKTNVLYSIYGGGVVNNSIYNYISVKYKNAYILICFGEYKLYEEVISTLKFM
jgi:hypothetical protein